MHSDPGKTFVSKRVRNVARTITEAKIFHPFFHKVLTIPDTMLGCDLIGMNNVKVNITMNRFSSSGVVFDEERNSCA